MDSQSTWGCPNVGCHYQKSFIITGVPKRGLSLPGSQGGIFIISICSILLPTWCSYPSPTLSFQVGLWRNPYTAVLCSPPFMSQSLINTSFNNVPTYPPRPCHGQYFSTKTVTHLVSTHYGPGALLGARNRERKGAARAARNRKPSEGQRGVEARRRGQAGALGTAHAASTF